jgi:Zn-dependent M28 family amino/carboxypeptidase
MALVRCRAIAIPPKITPVDEANLRRHVAILAGSPRVPGTPEHKRAGEYIQHEFERLGLSSRMVVERDGSQNIVAEVGNPRMPLFVVGAHYDSVGGSPGADDNASGVAALLELARHYASMPRGSHSMQLVAYDREEEGLLGSASHCARLRGTNVVGMFSLEMLGYTSPEQKLVEGVNVKRTQGDFLAVVSNPKSAKLLRMFAGLDSLLPVESVTVPHGTQAAMLARLSDHGSFWAVGWKALLVTDTAFLRNPHYHQSTDTPATLDYTFLSRSTDLVSKALMRIRSYIDS